MVRIAERLRIMARLARLFNSVSICLLVSACGVFQSQPGTEAVSIGSGTSLTGNSTATPGSTVPAAYGWLLPAGSYHMVTTRTLPTDSQQQQILCTEPSPDWAVAFGEALQLSAAGKAPSGIGASLSGSSTNTEGVTALVGRTAGVVALRDGLYAACQAYANHIIGKDAYGLIISQYGNLLVALAGTASGGGAGASGGAVPPTTPASPAGVAVAVSTGIATNAASPAATQKSTTATPVDNSQVALMQQEALQALVTVCITNSDPTERTITNAGNNQNRLLTDSQVDPKYANGGDYCHKLM